MEAGIAGAIPRARVRHALPLECLTPSLIVFKTVTNSLFQLTQSYRMPVSFCSYPN
jgi:hypothetical protein